MKVLAKACCIFLIAAGSALPGIAQNAQTIDDIIRGNGNNFRQIVAAAEAFFAAKGTVGTGYKEYRRWKAMVENNIGPDGLVPNMEAKNNSALLKWQKENPPYDPGGDSIAQLAGISNWTPLGQANPTIEVGDAQNGVGSVRCLEWSGNNIWAGTPGGGIWYGSFVSGTTYNWSARTDGLPNLAITDIEIAQTNTSVYYALTGAVGNASGYRSTGVIKSIDGGANWNPTNLTFPDNGSVKGYRLLCSSTTSNTVWAATTDGLYRTIDGGTTWNRCTYYITDGGAQNDMTGNFFEILYKPGSSTILYATGSNYFYISSDGGATFLRVDRTAAGLPTSGSRIQIGVSAANSAYVYLLYSNGTGFQALYLSTNSGNTFTSKSTTPNILGSQGWRNNAIAVSPNDATLVYVGGLDVFKSTNSGGGWTQIADWTATSVADFCHADIFELYCTGTYLYAATDGGVYRMTTSTDAWADLNGDMQTAQIYRFSVDPTSAAAYVTAGNQDNGTYKNSGGTYFCIGGADGMETAIRPSNTNVLYISAQDGWIGRSDDGGSNNAGIFSVGTANGICGCVEDSRWETNYVLRPGNDQQIFVGYKAVWYSTNQGASGWTRITPAFTNTIRNIEFSESNNTIFYATDGATVARYNLVSGSWTRASINGNLPGGNNFTRVTVDPTNSSHVLLSAGGYTDGSKVFETFDANAASPTWTNISRNLPNVPVNTVIMDGDAANTIYIGTDIGVFVTNDNRVNWLMYTNGLPTTRVYDLEINTAASPDYLFAATFGRGAWKTPTYTGCSASASLGGTLEGLKYYEVSTNITSTQIIEGGTGTSVGYNAGANITLSPGFHAKAGSKFEAYLKGCTSSTSPPKLLEPAKETSIKKAATTKPASKTIQKQRQ